MCLKYYMVQLVLLVLCPIQRPVNDDPSVCRYERVNNVKKRNPKLKTLLSVGGWNFGTLRMAAMLTNEATRENFATTSIKYLRDRNFDGLDLDFEYPGSRGSLTVDKHRYTLLVKVSVTDNIFN